VRVPTAAYRQQFYPLEGQVLAGKRQMPFPIPDIHQEKTRTIGHGPPSTYSVEKLHAEI
jgi:hypothetical protein